MSTQEAPGGYPVPVERSDGPETCPYKTVGGEEILADVYPPLEGEPGAVIVFIHGGCLMYGDRHGFHSAHLEAYRRAGYTVISLDYRLAPETKLPEIIADLRDAIHWVAEAGPQRFDVDPERIAVVGHSAGGYLTLMAGVCATPRPRALVSFYGYGDIVADWYGKPDPFYCQQPRVSAEEAEHNRGRLYLYYRQNGLWPREVGGRDPATEPEFFVPYCPAHNVGTDYPPTLLLHGDQDTDVPYAQSVQMAEVLTRHGVPHELVTMAGYGHGFDGKMDDPMVQAAFQRVLAFLDSHTQTGR
jgi:acetyl esterase/lipase